MPLLIIIKATIVATSTDAIFLECMISTIAAITSCVQISLVPRDCVKGCMQIDSFIVGILSLNHFIPSSYDFFDLILMILIKCDISSTRLDESEISYAQHMVPIGSKSEYDSSLFSCFPNCSNNCGSDNPCK